MSPEKAPRAEHPATQDALHDTARAVQAACLRAAQEGYERAGFSGLCEEGRWEMALDSIQSLDINAILSKLQKESENDPDSDNAHHPASS
jgi:hypothetical protein